MEQLTESDLTSLCYYWFEAGDLERLIGWEVTLAKSPELQRAYERYIDARDSFSARLKATVEASHAKPVPAVPKFDPFDL